MDTNYVLNRIDNDSEGIFFASNNNNDQLNKPLPSFMETFSKFAWSYKLTSDKQINKNTKDIKPSFSRQTSASCTEEKISIAMKNIDNVNESNAVLKENVNPSQVGSIALIDDKEYIPRYVCNICDKSFIKKHNLENYWRKHIGEYSYSMSANCMEDRNDMQKKYITKVNEFNACMEDIVEKRTTERTALMNNKEELRNNMLTNEITEDKASGLLRQTSKSCAKERDSEPFGSNYLLNLNQTHDGEKNHFCDTCGKCFTQKNDMKIHQYKHISKGPYLCFYENCNRSFQSKRDLNDHIKTHKYVRLFKCEYESCDKKFCKKYSMKIHLMVHMGQKIHMCEYCSKRFSQKSHMQTHVNRMHLHIKNYKCKQCEKSFYTSYELRKHEKLH